MARSSSRAVPPDPPRDVHAALGDEVRLFRGIFENAGIGIVIVDANGQPVRVNPSLCQMMGYTEAELLAADMRRFTHPDDLGMTVDRMERMQRGEPTPAEYEKRYLRRDGSVLYARVNATRITTPDGRFAGVLGQIQDISARKVAEEAQIRSERFAREIAELLPAIVFVFDVEARSALYVSGRGTNALLGRSPEEIMRMGDGMMEALVHPEDESRVLDEIADVVSRGEGAMLERQLRLRHADGTWRSTQIKSAVHLHDERAMLVGTVQDVTERRALEQQLRHSQKMEAIGRLAGGVAHDFNNLLTVILGYAESMRASMAGDDPRSDEADQIIRAGKRAAALTQQLLAFGRRQVMQPAMLDLNLLIADLGNLLHRLIGEDIALTVDPDPALGHVLADPAQMEQVILNLAINARDAMPRGGRLFISTLDVQLDREEVQHLEGMRPGRYACIRVRDTGQGMDAATQARIFEPFFTTKTRDRGTGLGLSMVYGIVKQSEGYIYVDSALDQGCTFDVYLPSATVPESALPAPEIAPPQAEGRETILVVEDDDLVRELARKGLRARGYEVLEAAGGVEGLALAEHCREPIHAVVTDLVMPGLNGREFARRLAHSHPESRVLFVSGYTDDTAFRKGGTESGQAFLPKPFTPEVLARRVRELLSTKRSRDERRGRATRRPRKG